MKITFIFSCSGMFRDVPACSGMFHVPGFIDALGKRRMEKLLIGYQQNVVTPFHYILVEQTNSVWDQIRFISSDFKLGASLSQAVDREKWSNWRRIAEYFVVPFRLRSSLRGKVGIKVRGIAKGAWER